MESNQDLIEILPKEAENVNFIFLKFKIKKSIYYLKQLYSLTIGVVIFYEFPIFKVFI